MREEPSSTDYSQSYFLKDAEGYDLYERTAGRMLPPRLQIVAFLTGDLRDKRLLDVGCGRGELVRCAARMGAEAYGVDFAEAAVSLSRQATGESDPSPRIAFVRGNCLRLPFCERSFDRIALADLVEHMTREQVGLMASELARVIRPDGYMVVHTAPNKWHQQLVQRVRWIRGQLRLGRRVPFRTHYEQLMHLREHSIGMLKRDFRQYFLGRAWAEGERSFRAGSARRGIASPLKIFSRDLWGIFWPRVAGRGFPLGERLIPTCLYIGANAWPCLGNGWLEMGFDERPFQWTRKEFGFLLTVNAARLVMECRAPHASESLPVRIDLLAGREQLASASAVIPSWQELAFSLPEHVRGEVRLRVSISHSWSPKELYRLDDERQLGMAVSKISCA